MRLLLIILALSSCPKDEPVDDTQIKSESIIQPCKENCVSAQLLPAEKR